MSFEEHAELADAEPLRPVLFAILVALGDRDLHGYGIMKMVNEQLRRRALLGPGTLYRCLGELREEGLIDYVPTPEGVDPRRRYFRITPDGRSAARIEAARMSAWVDVARAARLLGGDGA